MEEGISEDAPTVSRFAAEEALFRPPKRNAVHNRAITTPVPDRPDPSNAGSVLADLSLDGNGLRCFGINAMGAAVWTVRPPGRAPGE